jgi:nucleoid-associated protein YgaU
MAFAPYRVLQIFACGGAAVAAAAAAVQISGSNIGDISRAVASLAAPTAHSSNPTARVDPKTARLPPSADTTAAIDRPGAPEAKAPPAANGAPSFDVIRAEADGSMVIAGKAASNSKVEIMDGGTVIGTTVAGPDGDFALALDQPLKPGGYQLTIRSTSDQGVVATSQQTAVVSIPTEKDGQVLALINEPDEPSRLIAVPQPTSNPKAPPPAGQPKAAASQTGSSVAVEAVEVDGRKIFLAGAAEPGRKVRAYVDGKLLGEAKASQDGRFLIEAEGDISIGDHMVRVELLDANGSTTVATAAVPFQRDSGDGFAAVAPSLPTTPDGKSPQSRPALTAQAGAGSDPTLRNVHGAVVIRRGDSLWRISQRVYGHGMRYSTIYLANTSQIRNPQLIWPGQIFTVPDRTAEGERADMKAIGNQATTTPTE